VETLPDLSPLLAPSDPAALRICHRDRTEREIDAGLRSLPPPDLVMTILDETVDPLMFQLDPASSEPPFAQLREQITDQVAAGELRPGDKLPTVRGLAVDLGIAPNTVARAYRELEDDGLLVGRGRSGTFVAGRRPGEPAAAEAVSGGRQAAAAYARTARSLGLDPTEALALVRQALTGRRQGPHR
jgi:GntR family transcriptional regulator